jgi:hypothetical protein
MRRFVLMILLLLIGCGRREGTLREVLPVQVQRTWTLRETKTIPREEAPAMIRSLGLKRALLARYEGNGSITVRVYEMSSQTAAFEMIQKWPQKDGPAFYKSKYFIVAQNGPDRATLASFLQGLEQEFAA